MPRGVYAAASAMFTEQFAMDAVAENMANMSTPGFRRSLVVRRGFDQVLAAQEGRRGDIQTDGGTGIAASGSWRSFEQGELQKTDGPLDVGLQGSGFFLIRDDAGRDLVTRNGSFGLDDSGNLVTSEGWSVQGQGGAITIPSEVRRVVIDRAGRIYGDVPGEQGPEQVFIDQLRTVDVATEERQFLAPRSGQYFELGDIAVSDTAEGLQVQQGFIESSNVEPIQELVRMVALQRRYDSAQAALRKQLGGESFSSVLRGT